MSALKTRLKNVERATRPDCENCRYNQASRLSMEELDAKIKDNRRRMYVVRTNADLMEQLQEIQDVLKKREGQTWRK